MPKTTPKKKTQSLDEFIADLKEDIKKFEADYRKHHAVEPDHYPLEFPLNNSGLWFEFFTDFCTNEGD
jgi:hypothetical protein